MKSIFFYNDGSEFLCSIESMKKLIFVVCHCFCLLFLTGVTFAQGTQADYERLAQLRRLTSRKVFRTRVQLNWVFGDKAAWYRAETGPGIFEFVCVDLQKKKRDLAFDPFELGKQLEAATGKKVNPRDFPFKKIALDESLENVFFQCFGKAFRVHRASGKLAEIKPDEIPRQTGARTRIDSSGPSDVSIHISFKNDRKEKIRLYWIDQNGRPRHYADVEPGKSSRQHTYAGHVWLVTDMTRKPLVLATAETSEQVFAVDQNSKVDTTFPQRLGRPQRAVSVFAKRNDFSSDGKYRVITRDHNVFLLNRETDKEEQVTKDGRAQDYFTRDVYWSPDNKKFIVMREIPADKRTVYMVESSPRDQLQPKLHSHDYLKPGDNVRKRRPALFDAETGKQVPVSNELFANPWRLREFRWAPDSSEFYFRYNQRGHQVMRIVGIDSTTGTARAVIDEKTETFIDHAYKFKVRYLEKTGGILWQSERDGWNHIYLFDGKTGELKNQVTNGKWVVRQIDRIDEDTQQIWFQAGGIYPDQDPYYIHHCRVNFDGSNLVVLTKGDGTHSVSYSPTGKYLVDRYSKVDMADVHEIRDVESGELVVKLESGDFRPLLKTGWKAPERFIATARDNRTPIFGVIYRPTNFDPKKSYPVIEYIYAGPHGSFVPKSFSTLQRSQDLTELGFIVVQIDGMGTSNRSKAFHDVCWKNLGDSGFPDRIKWIKAAADKYPYMDIDRIGIYGGSAGGQSSTRALLAFGDFYKVAVSDCGCHDNRMDKIWWNEQWMGWPIGPHYKEQSNVTNAHKLKGKLFLIVGELDRNVDPASTMQVVNALIKANKDFDFLLVPGGGHGVGSSRYGRRRTYDFFVRHLHGVEPRSR